MKEIRQLIDTRRCVPVAIIPPRRYCLIYSHLDDDWFVVVQNYNTWAVITLLPMNKYAEKGLTPDSEQARQAKALALGLDESEGRNAVFDHRVRVYNPERPDPQAEATLTAMALRKAAIEEARAQQRQNPELDRLLQLHSGQSEWSRRPAFSILVGFRNRGVVPRRIPKALLSESLPDVASKESFRRLLMQVVDSSGLAVHAIADITFVVGEKRHPLTEAQVKAVIEACHNSGSQREGA